MTWEGNQCPNCKNYDSMVALPMERRHVTWTQHGNRVFDVHQYRCLACGAADIIRRDFHELHKDEKPIRGQYSEADGRIFVPAPPDPEEA